MGVATSTLRYYDRIGLVIPATRVSGQRRYAPDAVRRLRVIPLCKAAGFALGEIRQLLDGNGDWHELALAKLHELDPRIKRLNAVRRLVVDALACDCVQLETCARAGSVHLAEAADT